MHSSDHTDWVQLTRYVLGESDAHEREAVERWIGANSERASDVAALRQRWADASVDPSAVSSVTASHAWPRLQSALQAASAAAPSVAPRLRTRTSFGNGAAAAMMGAAAVLIAVVWRLTMAVSEPAVTRTYATAAVQEATVHLPDGSWVRLAPATTVRYEASGDTRRVDLVGEAYFTVAPDPRRTFVVHTGGVETRVLGTTFDVRRYATDRTTQVAVVDGKVLSRSRVQQVVLTAGTMGVLTDSTAQHVQSPDVSAAIGWTTGKLIFDDTPVSAVLERASRWCGYEFRVADSALASQRVNMVLIVGRPNDTMRALADLLDVHMSIRGNVVTLTPIAESRGVRRAAPTRSTTQPSSSPTMEVGK